MGVSLQEDGPTFEVGCPGERLVNVALPDGVPSQARQLRDDRHLTASRHSGQEVVAIPQTLSTVQAPFKSRKLGRDARAENAMACALFEKPNPLRHQPSSPAFAGMTVIERCASDEAIERPYPSPAR
jgi:hypothetical protein